MNKNYKNFLKTILVSTILLTSNSLWSMDFFGSAGPGIMRAYREVQAKKLLPKPSNITPEVSQAMQQFEENFVDMLGHENPSSTEEIIYGQGLIPADLYFNCMKQLKNLMDLYQENPQIKPNLEKYIELLIPVLQKITEVGSSPQKIQVEKNSYLFKLQKYSNRLQEEDVSLQRKHRQFAKQQPEEKEVKQKEQEPSEPEQQAEQEEEQELTEWQQFGFKSEEEYNQALEAQQALETQEAQRLAAPTEKKAPKVKPTAPVALAPQPRVVPKAQAQLKVKTLREVQEETRALRAQQQGKVMPRAQAPVRMQAPAPRPTSSGEYDASYQAFLSRVQERTGMSQKQAANPTRDRERQQELFRQERQRQIEQARQLRKDETLARRFAQMSQEDETPAIDADEKLARELQAQFDKEQQEEQKQPKKTVPTQRKRR